MGYGNWKIVIHTDSIHVWYMPITAHCEIIPTGYTVLPASQMDCVAL